MADKRKIKIKNEFGQIEYVDVDDIISPGLSNTYLDDHVLEQIKAIHEQLKDVLEVECPTVSMLEHFEIGFMRDIEPNIEIDLWGKILQAYYEAQHLFGSDFETRCLIFRYIIMSITDSFTEEEKKREDIDRIIKIWNKILREQEL